MKLLEVLINQLLTYAAERDNIDETFEKLRQTRHELRLHLQAEQRRDREEAAYWLVQIYKRSDISGIRYIRGQIYQRSDISEIRYIRDQISQGSDISAAYWLVQIYQAGGGLLVRLDIPRTA